MNPNRRYAKGSVYFCVTLISSCCLHHSFVAIKERFERNRVGLSLLGERELRQAILRDQETLRGLVNAIRIQERDLWANLRQFDQNLRTLGVSPPTPTTDSPLGIPRSGLSGGAFDSMNSPRMSPAIAAQYEQILYVLFFQLTYRVKKRC